MLGSAALPWAALDGAIPPQQGRWGREKKAQHQLLSLTTAHWGKSLRLYHLVISCLDEGGPITANHDNNVTRNQKNLSETMAPYSCHLQTLLHRIPAHGTEQHGQRESANYGQTMHMTAHSPEVSC